MNFKHQGFALLGDFWVGIFNVCLVMLIWVGLFRLNNLLFSHLALTKNISWIFLPAAIRVFSVLVLQWPAVLGLFFGGLLTADWYANESPVLAFTLAVLSSLGPWFAVKVCVRWLNLPEDLRGLTPLNLLLLAVVGAVCNVIPHNVYFYFSGLSTNFFGGLITMLVGDLIGSLFVLYLGAFCLRLLSKQQAIRRPLR
jgi:hypothetical protein